MFHVNDQVRFLDFVDLETRARDGLVDIVNRLESLKRPLVAAERQQLALCKAILDVVYRSKTSSGDVAEVCDPLFVATRALLASKSLVNPPLLTEDEGRLQFREDDAKHSDHEPASITLVALVLGILAVDGATPPPVKVADGKIVPDDDNGLMNAFTRQFFAAVGEANSYGALAQRVLALLCIEGDPDGRSGQQQPGVVATEFARVMRGLQARKIQADEPQLRRRINEELNTIQNIGGEDAIADLGIDLPNLEDLEDANIVADNVRVMGPMIVAAMFDELKVFQVVDRIVEQFQHGTLPIGPGNAGKLLYRYWRETPNRISEQERKNFAAITLGVPGGDPNTAGNREFNDLWIRFVSSVSSFVRQTEVDALLRASVPNPINHQQVRKAARDLAGNLSLHGYGMAHYAAREIQSQVKFMIDLLQDPEIRGCYGAKDMWQVIDQVATYDLGGARTSSRYRTLATCGTIITAWLANNVDRVNKATGPLLSIDQIANPDVSSNHKSTVDPTDYDLVNACELWLADTATTDTQIEQFSQPREAPQMTSKPVPIPAMAREMLDGVGDIGAGIGLGTGVPVTAGYGVGTHNGASYYSNRPH
ncbi:hypothetical protein ACPUER_25335 [Burkholderia sp. DN3021]|uniref:hypothetical protein n=1 Tax=Burkholderia TaxID=32008 RepID=UPI00158CAC0D|nr:MULTISPECIES: hypothetical protein [Burkholderia cepacia complex]MDR6498239.1 hypothetical protein [Burkholderia ambifaria]